MLDKVKEELQNKLDTDEELKDLKLKIVDIQMISEPNESELMVKLSNNFHVRIWLDKRHPDRFNSDYITYTICSEIIKYFRSMNCNECKHISLTEEEQEFQQALHIYKDHVCILHSERVIHRSNINGPGHRFIYPCKQCSGKDFQKR